MKRIGHVLAIIGAAGVGAPGCQPEVVLARADPSAASADDGGEAGSASGGVSGSASGGGGMGPSTDRGRLLADSVADFGFTQGEHGWSYGYDLGSLDTFTLMTKTSVIALFVPPSNQRWDCWASDTARWTQIFQLGAHPNGVSSSPPSPSVLQRAVRRWTSTVDGDVVIKGELAKIDLLPDSGTNGVDGFVYVDGVQLFTGFLAADDGAGYSYELTATLQLGSTVDFVLDPHESEDHHDLSRFTAIIVADAAATP
jgi:hypothetical protein